MKEKESPLGAAGLVALIAALILFYRFPDRLLSGFLWAEDGRFFLPDAYRYGFRSIGSPYEGYLHALPRLIAYLAARTTSVQHLQYVLPVVCVAITSLGAAVTYLAALRLPWRSNAAVWAALVSLSPLLIPHSGEVFLTITNLQWIAAPSLMALLYLSPSIPKKHALLAAVAALLISMSGPFSVIMLPFIAVVAACRYQRPISRTTVAVFAGYASGTLMQCVVILLWIGDTPKVAPVDLLDVLAHDLLGPAFLPHALMVSSDLAEAIAAAAVAFVVLWAIWRSPARLETIAVLFVGFIVWAAGVIKIGGGAHFRWDGDGARYTFLPYVFLAWALLIAAGTASSFWSRRLSLALCVALLLTSGSAFAPRPPENTKVERITEGHYEVRLPPGWNGTLNAGRLRVLP